MHRHSLKTWDLNKKIIMKQKGPANKIPALFVCITYTQDQRGQAIYHTLIQMA